MVRNQPPKKVFTFGLLTVGATMQKSFIFVLGRSLKNEKEECQKCLAYDKIVDPNGDAYYQENYDDLEADLENITNDFLRFVNEFNQIPTAYFELGPSSASH
ncbi:hypothetical protein L931_00990 [Helicobacter pylori PZ5024]|uniref:Uncharacterized protein n=1 Tax=Helicobacter pylori PZ5024 TaxID=1337391 RepID=T2T370_HELPX|nr:hypothetical protein L931_00990 [Helicobacter pylori PZ5024]